MKEYSKHHLHTLMIQHACEIDLIIGYHTKHISVTEKTFMQHYRQVNLLEDAIDLLLRQGVQTREKNVIRYQERIAMFAKYREEAFDFYLANYARQKKG